MHIERCKGDGCPYRHACLRTKQEGVAIITPYSAQYQRCDFKVSLPQPVTIEQHSQQSS